MSMLQITFGSSYFDNYCGKTQRIPISYDFLIKIMLKYGPKFEINIWRKPQNC